LLNVKLLVHHVTGRL